MAIVMVANGAFRSLVLAPQMGEPAAHIVSVLLGIGLILLITLPFMNAVNAPATRELLRIAAWWLGLTIAFEFLFGHFVLGASWGDLVGYYNVARGQLWPVVLVTIAIAPFLWASWRGWSPRRVRTA
jgi:hypothetical protein